MRTLTALMLLLGLTVGGTARALEASDCHGNRERLVAELAENRASSVRQLDAAIAKTSSDDAREQLRYEREEAWHEEENGLGVADVIWRDCLRYLGITPGAR